MSQETGAVKKIVIAGGGTAGWMAASGLAKLLGDQNLEIELVESEQIGTISVGEATLPHIRFFNQKLGLDEADFIAKTQATIKLGIEFKDWGRIGDSYIHPFGDYGRDFNEVDFHHYWLKLNQMHKAGRIDDYSLPIVMAEMNKFGFPDPDERSVMSSFSYAFQMDASLYAKYLRGFAENLGVKRTEGRIVDVTQHAETGFIKSLVLEDGTSVEGDIFLDCTGFRALLIDKTLKIGFEDWSNYLPCDRAIAVPCEGSDTPIPYTRATARGAGWQWRIPLQHRIGNGYVYCSEFISDDEACADILANLDGKPLNDPLFLKFQAGKRKTQWEKNCITIGLSSGFLEPLESTSIYLIQAAITNFIEMFPQKDCAETDVKEFNRIMDLEYERVKDFLILHYYATERDDTPFWNHVRNMEIPDSLEYKMSLFRERGIVVEYKDGLFLHPSWVAVYLGQRIVPKRYDPLVDAIPTDALIQRLDEMKGQIAQVVGALPSHPEFLRSNCPAPPVSM
ncbi:MAG: tryptophan halogenase [Robiginitomaculum sp.]|nr:MAG: tryptophan halogenase [Robiginitomaculum sp.]